MSTTRDGMIWFQENFGDAIKEATAGRPFGLPLLTAIAMQETGYIWLRLYKTHSVDDVLKVCVGDSLDYPNRKAFPRTKEDLLAVPQGGQMFSIARAALVDMSAKTHTFLSVVANRNMFCHGFGIFQLDLQFFKVPAKQPFFLQRQWHSFEACLANALAELDAKAKKLFPGKAQLKHDEQVYLAIAYNKGNADVGGGFKQGYKDGQGVYYGEHLHTFLTLAESLD